MDYAVYLSYTSFLFFLFFNIPHISCSFHAGFALRLTSCQERERFRTETANRESFVLSFKHRGRTARGSDDILVTRGQTTVQTNSREPIDPKQHLPVHLTYGHSLHFGPQLWKTGMTWVHKYPLPLGGLRLSDKSRSDPFSTRNERQATLCDRLPLTVLAYRKIGPILCS